jgi:hypothetical protein
MSYTRLIQEDCNDYLDAQTQNAERMLFQEVNSKQCSVNEDKFNLKRSTMNPNGLQNAFNNNCSNNLVEGFTNGGYSGNISGEFKLNKNECPVGHSFDGKGCRQICTHCTYRDNEPSSRSINEADICEPYGMFNGFDSNGYVKCLSKKNKDTDFYPLDFYSADSILVTNNPLHLLNSKRLY